MKKDKNESEANINRRRFMMAGAGAVAGTMALPEKSEASHGWGRQRTVAEPRPIPGESNIVQFFPELLPPFDFIHLFTPGPLGTVLPFTGIPLEGLNVEPITITDSKVRSAYAYLVGKVTGSDGIEYDTEVDLRVFKGRYRALDGEINYATFALI